MVATRPRSAVLLGYATVGSLEAILETCGHLVRFTQRNCFTFSNESSITFYFEVFGECLGTNACIHNRKSRGGKLLLYSEEGRRFYHTPVTVYSVPVIASSTRQEVSMTQQAQISLGHSVERDSRVQAILQPHASRTFSITIGTRYQGVKEWLI
jgi:hypothetical protein